MKAAACVIVLMLALAGCGSGAWHVVDTASAAPAAPGAAPAAAASCGFSAPDGSYTAIVLASGSVCSSLASGLAQGGSYWTPFTGANPGSAAPVCSLSSGDSTITVYDPTGVQEPIGGSVAQGVCASEEANGWQPS